MIYFDQASIQKPYMDAVDEAIICATNYWQNPSSAYSYAGDARDVVENTREFIAESINAKPEEIFFTSGSTESINWFCRNMGEHELYTTLIEHPAVLKSVKNPTFLPLNDDTTINWEGLEGIIPIALTSYINNEIGTICNFENMPRKKILFVDATQAYGHIAVDVKKIGADFLCASAQKFGGLPGTGFLYISSDIQYIFKEEKFYLQYGGDQERGIRAGTSNTCGIGAMGVAARRSLDHRRDKNHEICRIRDYLHKEISAIPCAHLNGTDDWSKRWAGNLNYRFDGYKGEELLAWFDVNGVCVSTGSACHAQSGQPSHVLKALGLTDEEAGSSIRFTFNETNTLEEAKQVVEILKQGLENLKHD